MARRLSRGLLVFLAVSCVMLAFTPMAFAATARSGNTVTIPKGEVVGEDLYVSGSRIVVDGKVAGDLIAAGQEIIVRGEITGDLQAVAQRISVEGTVGDDGRVAAQFVQLGPNALVGSDLLAASQSLDLEQGARVGRDLWAAGSDGLIAGEVGRDFLGAYSRLEIAGKIGRNATLQIGEQQGQPANQGLSVSVAPGLTVDSSATIGGKLVYTSESTATVQPGATITGGIQHKLPKVRPEQRAQGASAFALNQIRRLVTLVLIGLLLIWLFPGFVSALATGIEERPFPALGWGFVAFLVFIAATIGVMLAMIFLAVFFGIATLGSIVGLVIVLGLLAEALLIAGYIIFVYFVAEIVVSLLVGRLVLARTSVNAGRLVVSLLLGILIYWLVTVIPILGTLVAIVAALLALGSLWMWTTGMMQGRRQEPAPPPPAEAG